MFDIDFDFYNLHKGIIHHSCQMRSIPRINEFVAFNNVFYQVTNVTYTINDSKNAFVCPMNPVIHIYAKNVD